MADDRHTRRRPTPAAVVGLVGLIVVCFLGGFAAAAVRSPAAHSTPAPSTAAEASPTEGAPTPPATESPTPTDAGPPVADLVGQKLAIRMDGTTPSHALLARIRRGEVGAVVLFGENIVDEHQLIGLTRQLRAAARDAGQPPLLVMVDQEGGQIRRLPWAPPTDSATAMGAGLDAAGLEAAGEATAAALRHDGVDVDLAPVEDVPGSRRGFMAAADRTFGSDAAPVTSRATAFASGLRAGGVLPTLKHFPGLGRVARNTDRFVETVGATRAELDKDLAPFRAGIAAGFPLVMLSNATYDAWDAEHAAGWSTVIGTRVLRDELGFEGVTITDSLAGTAKARGTSERALAVLAAAAGTDMLMLTGPEADSARAFDALVKKADAGAIPMAALEASYARILALKATLEP